MGGGSSDQSLASLESFSLVHNNCISINELIIILTIIFSYSYIYCLVNTYNSTGLYNSTFDYYTLDTFADVTFSTSSMLFMNLKTDSVSLPEASVCAL